MIVVTCPHCQSRFRLPEHRVGPRGARVSCARCESVFDWIPQAPPSVSARPREHGVPQAPPSVPVRSREHGTPQAPPSVPARSREHGAHQALRSGHPASAVHELEAENATPETVVRLAVEELVSAGAEPLLEAYDRGALFSSFGPELLAAWQRCRDRLGAAADPAEFRAALSERLGVDVPGWTDRG